MCDVFVLLSWGTPRMIRQVMAPIFVALCIFWCSQQKECGSVTRPEAALSVSVSFLFLLCYSASLFRGENSVTQPVRLFLLSVFFVFLHEPVTLFRVWCVVRSTRPSFRSFILPGTPTGVAMCFYRCKLVTRHLRIDYTPQERRDTWPCLAGERKSTGVLNCCASFWFLSVSCAVRGATWDGTAAVRFRRRRDCSCTYLRRRGSHGWGNQLARWCCLLSVPHEAIDRFSTLYLGQASRQDRYTTVGE